MLFIYNCVNKSDSFGFCDNSIERDSVNYINLDFICVDKLKKKVKSICLENKFKVSKNLVNNVVNKIMSDYDNLKNIDYLIKMEVFSEKCYKDKTMAIKV